MWEETPPGLSLAMSQLPPVMSQAVGSDFQFHALLITP